MPSDAVHIDKSTPSTTKVAMEVIEAASTTKTTTSTADPGTGTTLAVTSAAKFPSTNGYQVRVENEVMTVTAGAGTTSWTVTRGEDNTTNVAHTSGVTVALNVAYQPVYPVDASKQITFMGMAAGFRTLGNAAATQNLLTIENAAGSDVLLAVRSMMLQVDTTVVLTAIDNRVIVSRPTAVPTGGTTLTKVAVDTALTTDASAIVRAATASDGGTATAITATAGAAAWGQYATRVHTAVGQIFHPNVDLLPEWTRDRPIILRAGEALLAQIVNPTGASNAATVHYTAMVAWDEYVAA